MFTCKWGPIWLDPYLCGDVSRPMLPYIFWGSTSRIFLRHWRNPARWDSEPCICALVLQIKNINIKNSQLMWCEFTRGFHRFWPIVIPHLFFFFCKYFWDPILYMYVYVPPCCFPVVFPWSYITMDSSQVYAQSCPQSCIYNIIYNIYIYTISLYIYIYVYEYTGSCKPSKLQAVHPRGMSGSSTPGVSWSSSRSGAARRAPVPESSRYSGRYEGEPREINEYLMNT